jgi:hypothetical protein
MKECEHLHFDFLEIFIDLNPVVMEKIHTEVINNLSSRGKNLI